MAAAQAAASWRTTLCAVAARWCSARVPPTACLLRAMLASALQACAKCLPAHLVWQPRGARAGPGRGGVCCRPRRRLQCPQPWTPHPPPCPCRSGKGKSNSDNQPRYPFTLLPLHVSLARCTGRLPPALDTAQPSLFQVCNQSDVETPEVRHSPLPQVAPLIPENTFWTEKDENGDTVPGPGERCEAQGPSSRGALASVGPSGTVTVGAADGAPSNGAIRRERARLCRPGRALRTEVAVC